MKQISEGEVELTGIEGILDREFRRRLDRGESVMQAVAGLVEDLDGFSPNDLLHEEIDAEFWCHLADADQVHAASGVGVTPRADAWFWHPSGLWFAVVYDATVGTWWQDHGGKPPLQASGQWWRPIYLWPDDGLPMVYRDPDGQIQTREGVTS